MGSARGRTGRWVTPWLLCAIGAAMLGAAPAPAATPATTASSGSSSAASTPADGADPAAAPAAAVPSAADPSSGSASAPGADQPSGTDQAPASAPAPASDQAQAQAPASDQAQAPASNQAPAAAQPAPADSPAAAPAVAPAVRAPLAAAPAVGAHPAAPASSAGVPCPTNCHIVVHKRADRDYYLPGQTVRYTVTVTDAGTDPCPPATVTDHLRGDLSDGVYQNNAAVTSGHVRYHRPDLVWTTGALAPGETVTMTYTVVANDPDLGPRRLVDAVTAPNSNCLTGAEAGCHVELGSPSWIVTKRENTEDVEPGNHIDYVITAHNTGTVDFTGVRQAGLEDDMSLIVKDSVYDADATASTGTVTVDKPYVEWRGDLPAGDTVTIKLSIRAEALPPHTSVLENIVRALYPHHGGTDLSDPLPPLVQHGVNQRSMPLALQLPRRAPVQPGDPTSTVPLIEACTVNPVTDSCDVTADEPKLIVKKSANRAVAAPGQLVTYRVAFANIGDNDFPAGELPVVTDYLGGVLNYADFVPGSLTSSLPSAVFQAAQKRIVWTGEIQAGRHAYFQYQVRVHKAFHTMESLNNLVVSGQSNCAQGSKDPGCRVHIPVLHHRGHQPGHPGHPGHPGFPGFPGRPGLAATGATVLPAAAFGGALLLAGFGLVRYRRRLPRR